MAFRITLTEQVETTLRELERDQRKLRRVVKALTFLEADPKYSSLNSHPYQTREGPNREPIFESYVENNTPSAWRIWWFYGPEQGEITIVEVGAHP
jgi:hypothetical protein